jgi:GNAT superfamily N-acetyltransferase
VIRRATVDDAPALARVQVRTWFHAYADYVDPDDLAAFPVGRQEPRWRELLAGPVTTWVWDQDGAIAGFASIGPARDEDADPGTCELYAIYVDPPAQGAGVGGKLLERAVTGMREAGYAEAVLWTFARNDHARAFYAGAGWRLDRGPDKREQDWAPSVRYRRAL